MPSSATPLVLNNGSSVPTFNSAASAAQVKSYNDYFDGQGDLLYGEDIGNRIANFFSGQTDAAKREYNTYLTNQERQYELAKINDARAWEAWLNSNKYQMAVKDLKAAGLNPWMAIQSGLSGGLSSSGVSNNASSSSSSAKNLEQKNEKKKDTSSAIKDLVSTALKVALMATMFAGA